MTRIEQIKPHARKEELVVRELTDEVLVYDLNRDKAHCLNKTAAFIWGLCDGQTTVAEMSRAVREQLKTPVDERVIWLALDQLERSNLLQGKLKRSVKTARMERREMLRKLGWAAAVSLPVITSIIAPTAVEAATCNNNTCTSNANCTQMGCTCQGPAPKRCRPA